MNLSRNSFCLKTKTIFENIRIYRYIFCNKNSYRLLVIQLNDSLFSSETLGKGCLWEVRELTTESSRCFFVWKGRFLSSRHLTPRDILDLNSHLNFIDISVVLKRNTRACVVKDSSGYVSEVLWTFESRRQENKRIFNS